MGKSPNASLSYLTHQSIQGTVLIHVTVFFCRYVTCNHAINFSNDLKLAHYVKVDHLLLLTGGQNSYFGKVH